MSAEQPAGRISASLIPEYDNEMSITRKHLERVPDEKLSWGPHDKSMTMGGLASHLAESVSWGPMMLNSDSMDFDSPEMQDYKPPNFENRAAILEAFDANVVSTREVLASKTDSEWMELWTMKKGDAVLASMPKVAVVRGFLMNHNVHHRGQLSVYLRMCDVPVPQTYGPSADETDF
jgi:uncharacterized damage-inducible protein DinB